MEDMINEYSEILLPDPKNNFKYSIFLRYVFITDLREKEIGKYDSRLKRMYALDVSQTL